MEKLLVEVHAADQAIEEDHRRVSKLLQLAGKPSKEKTAYLEEQIVHTMLTLRCPWCNAKFESFTACCALTCARCESCFCAWCQMQSPDSRSCHEHVMGCTRNPSPGELFCNEKVWNKQVRGSLIEKATAYIDTLKDPVAKL